MFLDFETRSRVDLKKVGILNYALHPSTEIICMAFSYSVGSGIGIWTPGTAIPQHATMTAHNAQFERLIWRHIMTKRHGAVQMPLDRWFCTAASAAAFGLPRGLDDAAQALGLLERKDQEGHKMMMKYTKPNKNGQFYNDPDELDQIYDYCKQDVRVEIAIHKRIPGLSANERKVYLMDQGIGDRGIGIDMPLVTKTQGIAKLIKTNANDTLSEVTNGAVEKATQVQRIVTWLRENQGVPAENLSKAHVQDLMAEVLPGPAREALTARVEGGKTSLAKLDRFQEWEVNGRLHYMLVYHGAHTGRWSARGAQPHNLPRGNVKNAERFIPLIMSRYSEEAYESIGLTENPAEVLSALLRPMFVAASGNVFFIGDYSAIEATITAWLAGQNDLVARYGSDEDVYEVEGDRVGATRQHGKAIMLGCGFGMGWKKFIQAAKDMFGLTISEAESKKFVTYFRDTYDEIPAFWRNVETACEQATVNPGNGFKIGTENYKINISVKVYAKGKKILQIRLPSGRYLVYHNPRIEYADGYSNLVVDKQNSITQQWGASKLYGGLITENIVQATARDIMAFGMMRLKKEQFRTVLTVHDEVICENHGGFKLDKFTELLSRNPIWAKNLPIKVKSFMSTRYKKD